MNKKTIATTIGGILLLTSCHTLSISPQNDVKLNALVYENIKTIPEISIDTIHIETNKDTVYLSGYVKTIRQSDEAYIAALRTPGVKAVENNIIVRK